MRRLTASGLALAGSAANQPPGEREATGRDRQLDGVTDHKRQEALLDRNLRREVGRKGQPRYADSVDDDLAQDHRRNGTTDVAIPAHLSQPPDQGSGEEEADEIAAPGADHDTSGVEADDRAQAVLLASVDRQEETQSYIEPHRKGAAAKTECAADDQDGQSLACDRHEIVWQPDRHVSGQGDEGSTDADERDVANPSTQPLADADGDEEVTDGHPTLSGGEAVQVRCRKHASSFPLRRGRGPDPSPGPGAEFSRRSDFAGRDARSASAPGTYYSC